LKAAGKLNLRPNNPSLALSKANHLLVTAAQRAAGLLDGPLAMDAMSAAQNIAKNISILRSLSTQLGVTSAVIDELESAALAFARSSGL
jgi:hypothetical protein